MPTASPEAQASSKSETKKAHSPEVKVASKLLEAIRAKEKVENMQAIVNSLSSEIPELDLDRTSKNSSTSNRRISKKVLLN